MSSVYFPLQVVILLRRLVNAISAFSISNHYLRKPKSIELEYQQDSLCHSTLHCNRMAVQLENAVEREVPPSPLHNPHIPQPKHDESRDSMPKDIIHQLLANPALYDPLRVPRYPIVLCHGLYGFDTRGPSSFPSMRMHYWANVLNILRAKLRAEVIITSVPGTGSIASRAAILDQQLHKKALGRGINFIAHSMGGLDCRHLISHVKPTEYAPLSLTTISTPHRGSPFMDWCAENIGLGKLAKGGREVASKISDSEAKAASETEAKDKVDSNPFSSLSSLPSSFTTLLLSILDSPAYANLTSTYLNNVFNPATPNDPNVKYFSVAGRMSDKVNIWHPFWLPKLVLDGVEHKERAKMKEIWENARRHSQVHPSTEAPLWARDEEWGNDGLVTIQSAKWGQFLGVMEGCDHWEIRGARGIEFGVDLPAIPAIGLRSSVSESDEDGWGWLIKSWRKEQKAKTSADWKLQRERERQSDDDVVKSSTEKLSAVFDWLAEQVPAPPLLGSRSKAIDSVGGEVDDPRQKKKTVKEPKKNELETKLDLERFYIALSRKLYDEGL